MYDSPRYADSRLSGTLVRLNGKAVYVQHVGEGMMCRISDTAGDNEQEVPLDALEIKSPPLGFVAHGAGCKYLSRKPMQRDWRQGVRENSVMAVTGRSYSNKVISKCINGEFSSRKDWLIKLRDGYDSVPLSRQFAVARSRGKIVLKYKWYGIVAKRVDNSSWELAKKWSFLQPLVENL